ncbi:MAG: hypothetical protein QNJ12_19815 [Ilumatobacter sp.]|uniref:WD40 repeat domain-containing protein n=1 Tax=Ilumatobacter sp. TaxID=1967498 RepID=UPI002614334F|nr:hypothetical protein [Ilumatobacter sp.]MDJ0771047.1 hypothetical protein [Ilumatobacter sp.]
MREPGEHRRLRGALAVAASTALLVGACSSDSDDTTATDFFSDIVLGVSASPAGVWGDGRAVMATSATDGTVAVATTTGVHVLGSDGQPASTLHRFDETTQLAAIELSPDDGTLVVATSTPSRLLWFDLVAQELQHVQDLDVSAAITALTFTSDGSGVVAATGANLSAWPDGPLSGPIPLTDAGASIGRWVVRSDGIVVAPVAETDTLALVDENETSVVRLESIGAATVLDARAGPGGDTIAVTVGEGQDALDRRDRILLLDPQTFAVRSEIALDRAVPPDSWVVNDAHVAVLGSDAIDVFAIDGTPVTELTVPTDATRAELLPLESGFALVQADGAITAWDSATWAPLTLDAGGVSVRDAAVDASGRAITTVGFYGDVTRWDTTTGTAALQSGAFALGEATSVAVSSSGDRIGVASNSGRVAVLDRSLADQWVFGSSRVHVGAVEFNPVSGMLATGLAERTGEEAFDDTVASWDPVTQSERFRIGGESEDVAGCSFFYNRIRFTGDGALLARTSHDYTVAVVDAETGAELQRLSTEDSTLLDIGFTPDDELLVATRDNAAVTVWDTEDFSIAAEYRSPMGGYLAIAMLPDAATMAAADITGALSLVDVMTGEILLDFEAAGTRTTSIAVSDDGLLLAAPAADSTIGIWSTEDGRRLATLAGHTADVTDVAFAPDGTWLASSSLDATARAWDLTVEI